MGGRVCDTRPFSQVLPYDYYGAYGHQAHADYAYGRLLGDEYTFDFPPHHHVVSAPAPLPSPTPALMGEQVGLPEGLAPARPAGPPGSRLHPSHPAGLTRGRCPPGLSPPLHVSASS